MPLLDHFHPPLHGRRHWEAFHGWWAAEMASSLNERLPAEYFAEFQVTLAEFPDDIEVQVFNGEGGPVLVAAIELVSPGNKDRPETRQDFIAKCSAYLQRGIGVMVVDIVTSRHGNLHDELLTILGHQEGAFPGPPPQLYATAYRPARREERSEIDLWCEPLAVGSVLPTLPLAIRGLGCLPIDLESTYMDARQRGRIA